MVEQSTADFIFIGIHSRCMWFPKRGRCQELDPAGILYLLTLHLLTFCIIKQEAEQLEREQEVLRENVKKLQAQKRKLGNLLDKHEPACSNKIEPAPSAKTFADGEIGKAEVGE